MPAGCGNLCCARAVLYAFYFIYCILVIFVVALYIFWLIFRPQNIQFNVDNALLTQFDLIPAQTASSTSPTLLYNLALNVSFRNPNKRVSVHFERIRAIASYGDKSFAVVMLNSTPVYRQGEAVLRPVFLGQKAVGLGKSEIERYNLEKAFGIFRVDVKFDLRIRLSYGKIKTGLLHPPMVECVFKVSKPIGEFEISRVESSSCGHVLITIIM